MSQKSLIIDTREPEEYHMSHVEGAINIPPMEFMRGVPKALKDVPKDTQIIVYCRTGQRSNTCGKLLGQAGYTNIVNGVNEHRVRVMLQSNS